MLCLKIMIVLEMMILHLDLKMVKEIDLQLLLNSIEIHIFLTMRTKARDRIHSASEGRV